MVFTPADAGTAATPILYEAAPDAHPVFIGGSEIKGFHAGADGIWRVKIPEVAEGKWYFEQLFAGGRRMVRAREPDLLADTLFDVRLFNKNLSASTTASHFAIADIKETDLGGGKARQSLTVGADAAWIAKAKAKESDPIGILLQAPRAGGATQAGLWLRGIATSPDGGLRISLILASPLQGPPGTQGVAFLRLHAGPDGRSSPTLTARFVR